MKFQDRDGKNLMEEEDIVEVSVNCFKKLYMKNTGPSYSISGLNWKT